MAQIDIEQGMIDYEDAGPADARPVVCVPGFLMGKELFASIEHPLTERGLRVIRLTLPLGAHRSAMRDCWAATVDGASKVLADVLEALDLRDVVLVGNDTGGAICQLTLVNRPERIGAVVLTNCDSFERFPPSLFSPLKPLARAPRLFGATMRLMRFGLLRRSPIGYGLLSHGDIDEMAARWVEPMIEDPAVMADIVTTCRSLDPKLTLDAAGRLHEFDGPALIVWGVDDRLFPPADADRLAAAFRRARVEKLSASRTFTMVDQPDQFASLVGDFALASDMLHAADR